jgi:DNA-binding transcriptional LysR family regulator
MLHCTLQFRKLNERGTVDYFTAVRAFVRVVETGSFARAADTLQFPRNTVTKLVQSLEAHLQVKLLHRTTRKVSPTNDGAAYFQRMTRLLDEWQEAEAEVAQARTAPRGRLRVDMGTALAALLVIPSLAGFRARYPDMQLDFGVSDRPADLVGEGIDCVVRAGAISDPSLIARHIGSLPMATCASPAYLAQHGVPQHPAELASGHTLIRHFFAGTARQAQVVLTHPSDPASPVTVSGHYFLGLNDSNAMLAAAMAGLGVLHCPAFITGPQTAAGMLQPLLADWSAPAIPIHVVYPANRHLSARTRAFVAWMMELFSNSPYALPPGPQRAPAA